MTATLEVFGTRLATQAKAETQPDGTVRVRGLPIFSEVFPDDPDVLAGQREVRDRAWLARALQRHQARKVLGYSPPMTLRHIFDGPERVGTYELTHLEECDVNPDDPRPRWTIIGDKVYESVDAFQKAECYDYRSPEISPSDPEELAALALLRDKAPYNKYPNVREAFEASGRPGWDAPQIWRQESFSTVNAGALSFEGAKNPYAVANSMANKGEITRKRVGEVGDAIKEKSETTKEGAMPPTEVKDEKKAPSVEERMESMAAKFFEGLSKKFEAYLSGMKDEGKDKKPEQSSAEKDAPAKRGDLTSNPKSEGEEDTKREMSQAAGPNGNLPPAVSQVRPGEAFEIAARKNGNGTHAAQPAPVEAFSAKFAVMEQANLGLQARVQKLEAEKMAVHHVAGAKKALADMGVTQVSEAFEARLHDAAVRGGEAACRALLDDVKLTMGMVSRAPEAFGALQGSATGTRTGQPDDLAKAIELFGQRPDKAAALREIYQDWTTSRFRQEGDSFVRLVEGIPDFNPSILGARGGRKG